MCFYYYMYMKCDSQTLLISFQTPACSHSALYFFQFHMLWIYRKVSCADNVWNEKSTSATLWAKFLCTTNWMQFSLFVWNSFETWTTNAGWYKDVICFRSVVVKRCRYKKASTETSRMFHVLITDPGSGSAPQRGGFRRQLGCSAQRKR